MDPSEEFVMQYFEAVWKALKNADIQRLESFAAGSPFPCGLDGWLGRYWLTNAIDAGNADAVAWVLSKKPDVNYVDDEGFTAVMSVLQQELDYRKGVIKNAGLLNCEAQSLAIQMIDLLCDAGADINLATTLGTTALHSAARWSSPAVVRHLLLRGADPLAIENDSLPRRPAEVAKDAKRQAVFAVLREAEEAQRSGL